MNIRLKTVLETADRVVLNNNSSGYGTDTYSGTVVHTDADTVHVGVDLGTAYTVIFVLDKNGTPLAGEYRFAQVVRDGVVVDFMGAIDLVRAMKERMETRLGFSLTSAAASYPPGVNKSEVRAVRHILESSGLECSNLVDEPSAANTLLQVDNGVIVDIGGGTTGLAVIENGTVVYTADEPTGGTHMTLVVAGSHKVPFDSAEAMKIDPTKHDRLGPILRPVMEKIGTIIQTHVERFTVERIYLVGGTSNFGGIAEVVQGVTGIPTVVPGNPLFVTPIGIAMNDGGK